MHEKLEIEKHYLLENVFCLLNILILLLLLFSLLQKTGSGDLTIIGQSYDVVEISFRITFKIL